MSPVYFLLYLTSTVTMRSFLILVVLFASLPFVYLQATYQPCPPLGPRFPLPAHLSSSKVLQGALTNLTVAFDAMAVNSDSNDFTSTTPNTTSFSVAIFSSDPVANASSPFFYQYHHAASNVTTGSSGMDNVDADSVYNVARVTTVFTVFAFLVAVGDAHWLEPVTQYIPELASHQGGGVWHDVRLIDLASNLAGIARDSKDCFSDTFIY